MMLRIFIDSSVLFSASYSSRGFARDLIILAVNKVFTPIASPLVLEETRRNLAAFSTSSVPFLEKVIELVNFELVTPSRSEIQDAIRIVALKDAPILAAAKIAGINALVTLDQKHLLGKPALVEYIRSPIITPKEAYALISKEFINQKPK